MVVIVLWYLLRADYDHCMSSNPGIIHIQHALTVMKKVRIIFRMVQYSSGTDVHNPILTHEFYEYLFDAVPMLLALATLNFTHPGRIIQGPSASWPRVGRKEKKETKRKRRERKAAEKLARKKMGYNVSSPTDIAIVSLRPREGEEEEC
jgi:hypothetical protein